MHLSPDLSADRQVEMEILNVFVAKNIKIEMDCFANSAFSLMCGKLLQKSAIATPDCFVSGNGISKQILYICNTNKSEF